METRLFNIATTLFLAAGLFPTPKQEQENAREACDWACEIADKKATEADFIEATQSRITDILAEQ